jgi:hypothetical protein
MVKMIKDQREFFQPGALKPKRIHLPLVSKNIHRKEAKNAKERKDENFFGFIENP